MAYLLFGVSPSQLSALQLRRGRRGDRDAQRGSAEAVTTRWSRLQKTLGLDRLSVATATTTTATGATENTGAAIEAGRYVTKRVYVGGQAEHHRAPAR